MILLKFRTIKLVFDTHLDSHDKLNGCIVISQFLLLLISGNRVKIDKRGDSSLLLYGVPFSYFPVFSPL